MPQPKENIPAAVEKAIGPLLDREGYEIVLVDYKPGPKILRLFLDHPQGVGLEDCSRMSRLVSDVLDGEGYSDMFAGRYTLEVSSPGLDRPLVKPQHYQKFIGRQIQLKTLESKAGQRRFRGFILSANEHRVSIKIDDRVLDFDYRDIEKANLVFDL